MKPAARWLYANKLLDELAILHPEEIDVEAIAEYVGATVVYEELRGCGGGLVARGRPRDHHGGLPGVAPGAAAGGGPRARPLAPGPRRVGPGAVEPVGRGGDLVGPGRERGRRDPGAPGGRVGVPSCCCRRPCSGRSSNLTQRRRLTRSAISVAAMTRRSWPRRSAW